MNILINPSVYWLWVAAYLPPIINVELLNKREEHDDAHTCYPFKPCLSC